MRTRVLVSILVMGWLVSVGRLPRASEALERFTDASACSGTWRIVPSPNPGKGSHQLSGVTAFSESDVWAVGSSTEAGVAKTLALHWDGSVWARVPSPNPGLSNTLNGVAGSSPSDIWAVGFRSDPPTSSVLVIHWNGVKWHSVPAPGAESELLGVSALTSADAWAVGEDHSGYHPVTLTERWDGVEWKIVPSPNPGMGGSHILNGVSMAAGNDVWTVGFRHKAIDPPITTPIALHWNGVEWVDTAPPAPTRNTSFTGVSAQPSTAVLAVGSYLGRHQPTVKTLIEVWDGTAWAKVGSPNPSSNSFLTAVTAVNSTDAVAVGATEGRNGHLRPLITHDDGTGWALDDSQRVPSSGDNVLQGVTVLPDGHAWSVGYFALSHHSDTTRTLVEEC